MFMLPLYQVTVQFYSGASRVMFSVLSLPLDIVQWPFFSSVPSFPPRNPRAWEASAIRHDEETVLGSGGPEGRDQEDRSPVPRALTWALGGGGQFPSTHVGSCVCKPGQGSCPMPLVERALIHSADIYGGLIVCQRLSGEFAKLPALEQFMLQQGRAGNKPINKEACVR